MRRKLFVLIGAVLVLSAMGGCRGSKRGESQKSGQAHVLPREGTAVIVVNGVPATVEISRSPEARRRGLMFRKHLPPDEGMLFVFEDEGYHSFWMKNTYISLSIAFIDGQGEIIQIEDMEPLDDSSTHIPLGPVLYALEMNRGWFRDHGIRVGDRVEF